MSALYPRTPTPTPTEAIGHLQHSNPTDGPTQLSKTHPNIVNYAISAGCVLCGVAFIAIVLLLRRCSSRRKQDVLDAQIDARLHENTAAVSRMTMAASRTQSLAKLPNAALPRYPSMRPLAPARTTSTNSSTSTLVGAREFSTYPEGTALAHTTAVSGVDASTRSPSRTAAPGYGFASRMHLPQPGGRYAPFVSSRVARSSRERRCEVWVPPAQIY